MKKWGEYLLEFLMLFLAVFLGFVAENIREHSVEGRKEKEYIKSIIADLKTDSVNLQFIVYNYFPELNKWVDSCVTILIRFCYRRKNNLPGNRKCNFMEALLS